VAQWRFDGEDPIALERVGGVEAGQAGPRPPEYPGFGTQNMAVKFDGKGARLIVEDPGDKSQFDFSNGDSITLEAWVKLDDVKDDSPMYVIGKGRSGSAEFPADNQNWAMRLVRNRGVIRVSFLFATKRGAGTRHWHRWTSLAGFQSGSGWHHVAVGYRFGEPKLIKGWIDGKPTDGIWDMGGPTIKEPIVDDDDVWIGSALRGNPGNSLLGTLDSLAVHRVILNDSTIASRFQREGGPRIIAPRPAMMPQVAGVPVNQVLVTVREALPTHERWANQSEVEPSISMQWEADRFLLPRIPLHYDEWGIRDGWRAPVLVRMSSDVDFTPGKNRILLRARGLSRLWIDGKLVAETEPITKQPPNGEEPITPLRKPPLPGLRVAAYHQQEIIAEMDIPQTPTAIRVVLEMLVGGKNLRTETGEICVAVQPPGSSTFHLLQPSLHPDDQVLPLTDEAVEPELDRIQAALDGLDTQRRRQLASSQDEFWKVRHEHARRWAATNASTQVPQGAGHALDAFIKAKIDKARRADAAVDPKQSDLFHKKVLPVLRENCFRCHGEKDKGGLHLDSRAGALRGGDSENPAVVPGDVGASELIGRLRAKDEALRMPPTGDALSESDISAVEAWIQRGAFWPPPPLEESMLAQPPIVDDEVFLRRIYLDTIGLPPSAAEVQSFLDDDSLDDDSLDDDSLDDDRADKRGQVIDQLIADERTADHWMSFWQDLLAENPTLLNASLNSTGPFRWFLYDSLRDNKPLDRMVTELILMRGGQHEGGSAGFAMAAENDAPYAAKSHILASAFLGIELQCARCHDSPYHTTTQSDLYSLAAMLERKSTSVPSTSQVPAAFFDEKQRESLIQVTLDPGQTVNAVWPFADETGVADSSAIDELVHNPSDSRERIAALMTSPQNGRFSRVIVNRIWKRLMGTGIVEPIHDWEDRAASHPQMLAWLADELVRHRYDARHVIRLIVTSNAYQREATGRNSMSSAELRFFVAPERRRLSAEQIVDSLFTVTGSKMDVEELTFVHDGRRAISNRLTLGKPRRAWMFASLNNERDRPSLALPRSRAVADVLEAFGWSGSRQKPIVERDVQPNVLQAGVLANGVLTHRVSRAADGSVLAQLAIESASSEELVATLFLSVLNRRPRGDELATFSSELARGFDQRLVPAGEVEPTRPLPPLRLVTWFNHLRPDANRIQQEVERRVRLGPPPDPRLRAEWREAYEDAVWSLINHREFVWVP
jgi:mono/diheme cytochrome c family protein